MSKLARALVFLVIGAVLASCQSKLQPGDKIGDMLFISDYTQCPGPNFSDICGFDTLADGSCQIPAEMTAFWISTGWAEDTQEKLEEAWKDSEWSMTFDGQAVDLESFGTYDFDLQGQKARAWNVCISNPAPGKHTVIYSRSLKAGSEPGNRADPLIFTVLE